MIPLEGSKSTAASSIENVRKKLTVPPVESKFPFSVGAARLPPTMTDPWAPTSTFELCTRTSLPAFAVTLSATGGSLRAGPAGACGFQNAVSGMRALGIVPGPARAAGAPADHDAVMLAQP